MSSIFLLFTLPDLINELANQMSLFKEKKKKINDEEREHVYCVFILLASRSKVAASFQSP